MDRSWEYINRSQTHECGNWYWGRAIPRKGIHKLEFPCSVAASLCSSKTVSTIMATSPCECMCSAFAVYHLSCWYFFTFVAWLLKLCLSCHSATETLLLFSNQLTPSSFAVATMLLQHSLAALTSKSEGEGCTSRPFFPRWWGSRMPPVDPARINYHPDRSPHGDTPPPPPPARLTWVLFRQKHATFFRTFKRY